MQRIRFASVWRCAAARRSVLVCAMLLVPLLSGRALVAQNQQKPEDNQRPVDEFVTQIRSFWSKSEEDRALDACNKLLAANPKDPKALLYRGITFNKTGEYDNAIKDFDAVLETTGRNNATIWNRADAYANRSISYRMKGESLKAIDSAFFALLEKGDHAEAHNNRGLAYISRRQFDKAIYSFDRAIQSDAKFGEAYSNRGEAWGMKGNLDQAIADQKKAIELDGQLAVAFQRRAHYTVLKGVDAKTISGPMQDLESALKIQPGFVDALCDRAELYAMGNEGAKAKADLDEAIKLNPKSAKARIQYGRAYLSLKKPETAMEYFDKAVELNGQDKNAYSFRGTAQFQLKNYEAAAADFSKAIELDPKFETALRGRAEAYKKLGRQKEEKADLAVLNEIHPPAPPKKGKSAPKSAPKPVAETTPKFKVTSKEVDPKKRPQALASAKKIDSLIEANYTKTNTKPNPETNDYQFVRRVYLDITGTIPTYQEIGKFLSSKSADKRLELIDELLSSDGYARHQFNYWVDVLRYVDNLSNDVRGEPYRQWIKQSLAENKHWDTFVGELLTAEGLIWKQPMAGYYLRDTGMPLDNMNNTVRIFLGTRIGCAQCHDHPFDRWTQKEFYQMAAFTFGTTMATGGGDKRYWNVDPNDRLREEYAEIEQEEEDRRNNSYRFDRIIAANMRIVNDQADRKIHLPKDYKYENGKPDQVVEPKTLFGFDAQIKPGESPRRAFSNWVVSKDNPRFALTIANRLWKQAFGIGQIEPVDDMMDDTKAENPELMSYLEAEMKRLDFDMKEYLRAIFYSATYQREASYDDVAPGEPYHFPGPILRRMTAEQAWDSFLTLAVVDPDEYRELPSNVRTDVVGADLSEISAVKLMDAENQGNQIDGSQYARQSKYMYKGVLLARASELPSPVPPNHFLRIFGQSDRELISASSTNGSVPQILFMFNGLITHMLLEPKSTIYNNVVRKKTDADRVKAIFLTILSREPDKDELDLGKLELKKAGAAGAGNLVWSLVNTREFLFIQ